MGLVEEAWFGPGEARLRPGARRGAKEARAWLGGGGLVRAWRRASRPNRSVEAEPGEEMRTGPDLGRGQIWGVAGRGGGTQGRARVWRRGRWSRRGCGRDHTGVGTGWEAGPA